MDAILAYGAVLRPAGAGMGSISCVKAAYRPSSVVVLLSAGVQNVLSVFVSFRLQQYPARFKRRANDVQTGLDASSCTVLSSNLSREV